MAADLPGPAYYDLHGAERLPAGSFESIMTFMQALTEAVKSTDEAMLLVSIPESNIEIGGKAGQEALETLSHIVGRIDSIKISGSDSFYGRAARKLKNDGLLITTWSPDILRMELDKYIWSEERVGK